MGVGKTAEPAATRERSRGAHLVAFLRGDGPLDGRPVVLAVRAYYALFTGYALLSPRNSHNHQLAGALGLSLPALAAFFLLALTAARTATRRARYSWSLLALACLAYWVSFLADFNVDVLSSGGGGSLGTYYLRGGYFLFAIAGLVLMLPPVAERFDRAVTLVDTFVLQLAVDALIVHYFVTPSFAGSGASWASVATSVTSLADVLLLACVVSLVLIWPDERLPGYVRNLSLAFVVIALGNTLSALVGSGLLYAAVDPGLVLVPLGFSLLASAGATARPQARGGSSQAEGTRSGLLRFARSALPVVALPVAGFVLYVEVLETTQKADDVALVVIPMLVAAWLLVRQFLRVNQISRQKDQLSSLNQLAVAVSGSKTADEVVEAGLEAVTRLFGQPGGIWLRGPDESLRTVGREQGLFSLLGGDESSMEPVLTAELRTALYGDAPQLLTLPVRLADGGEPRRAARPDRILVAPLRTPHEVLGVLALRWPSERVAHSHLNLLEPMSLEIALGLENALRLEEAKRLAERDPLTGLLNHRSFHARLEAAFEAAAVSGQGLALLMADVDDLKRLNDAFGHPTGDEVLRSVARILQSAVREGDCVARYGGDEFVVLLAGSDREGAETFARRLEAMVHGTRFVGADGSAVAVSLSFGAAAYPDDALSANQLISLADGLLYESKGRKGDAVADHSTTGYPTGPFGPLNGLIAAIDSRDHYTRRHSEEVTANALMLAHALRLSEESCRILRISALLHDVGKIGVPEKVLAKLGALDDAECEAIKQHPLLSEMIVKEMPYVRDVTAAVGSHHERFDGNGYPRGLAGEDIPLLGRILAVADAFSAMTVARPERWSLTIEEAKAELRRVAGTQLDPALVARFIEELDRRRDGSGPMNSSAA